MGSGLCCFGTGNDNNNNKNANNSNNIMTPIGIKEDKTKQSRECVKATTPSPSQNKDRKNHSPEKHIFIWRIDGVASLVEQGKGRTQTSFEMHGIAWSVSLTLMDKIRTVCGKQITLRLTAEPHSLSPDYVLETKFNFFLHNQTDGKHIEREGSHTYSIACNESKLTHMGPLYSVRNPWDGYLVNDTIALGVEFIEFKRVPCNSVQRNITVYKSKPSRLYSWYIDDFFQLNKPAASSEPFQFAGYTWRLSLEPESTRFKDYVAIFLVLEDESGSQILPSSGILVEAVFSIERQSQEALAMKIRYTFNSTAKRWGYSKFVRYEDFIDPSKGYLVKGTCTIEASVCVLGSSDDLASKEAE